VFVSASWPVNLGEQYIKIRSKHDEDGSAIDDCSEKLHDTRVGVVDMISRGPGPVPPG